MSNLVSHLYFNYQQARSLLCLWLLGFMCFGWLNPANANPLPTFVAQSQQSIAPEIFQHCRFTGQRCLQHVDRFLLAADPDSIYWYELMLLKLDSLFILQRDAQLYALTSKLVLNTDSPSSFQARLFIYHAKVLYGYNDKINANQYLQRATALLTDLNQAMPNPLTELRLINVKLYSDGDYQSGYQQLRQLETKLTKSRDAVLKYDLYNNLGHFTYYLQRHQDSLHYRQLAINAIRQIDHPHKMAEAHYNLARAQSFVAQWPDAELNFANALRLYSNIDDATMVQMSLMYLAEAMVEQHKDQVAAAIFNRLLPAKIPNSSQLAYQNIKQKITY